MLMESVSKKTTLFENIGPPLLQNVDKVNLKYLKYYSQLKKGRPYVFKKSGLLWD